MFTAISVGVVLIVSFILLAVSKEELNRQNVENITGEERISEMSLREISRRLSQAGLAILRKVSLEKIHIFSQIILFQEPEIFLTKTIPSHI